MLGRIGGRRMARDLVVATVALATLGTVGTVSAQEGPPDSSDTSTSTAPSSSTPVSTSTTPDTTTEDTTTTTVATSDESTTTTEAVATSVDEPIVVAAAPDPPVTVEPTCRVGAALRTYSTGASAGCVEQALSYRGYPTSLDGDLNDDVQQVVAFQRAQGWSGTSYISPMMLFRLGIHRSATPTCTVSATLRTYSTGASAGCVEQALSALGYPASPNNDLSDDVGLVVAFQRAQGWSGTSRIGPAMLGRLGIYRPPPPSCRVGVSMRTTSTGLLAGCVEQALDYHGYAASGDGNLANDVGLVVAFQRAQGWSGTSRIGPAMLGRLGIWGSPAAPPSCRVSTTLRVGASGATANCLEQRLAGLLLPIGPTRSYVDATDEASIRAFQAALGLPVDGLAGPTTLSALGIWDANPTGLPSNSGSGRRVVYSRSQQRVWAVDASGVVVKTHRVSGRRYEPYAGTYSVFSRSLYTHSRANPNVKWRYMVRFTVGPGGDNIGFHEIPTKFGVPLQSVAQLGQPLSGGCVRQATGDAQWMWNWAGIGTRVVVL
ncbi:MAG: peptidoglycan-binding protein [Desertimonas sp.]